LHLRLSFLAPPGSLKLKGSGPKVCIVVVPSFLADFFFSPRGGIARVVYVPVLLRNGLWAEPVYSALNRFFLENGIYLPVVSVSAPQGGRRRSKPLCAFPSVFWFSVYIPKVALFPFLVSFFFLLA